MLATQSPFPQYTDVDGRPLDRGELYFGAVNQNPETVPVTVYWDAAGTQPAAQPILTLNGYTVRNGTPAIVYAAGEYSLTVRDRKGRVIYYAADSAAFSNDFVLGAIVNNLGDANDVTHGDALIAVKQPYTGAVARTQHGKNSDILNLLDFGAAGAGGDDTAIFQLAVNSHRTFFVPKGTYNVTSVVIDAYGCDIRFDKEAVVNVTGNGFRRSLLQSPRATFIASNPLLDATNYYFTLRITGGTFIVAAGATAISDRVPFLVNTAAAPSQILLMRPLVVKDAVIYLNAASAIGIGIHGGWGATVEGGSITAAGLDAVAIDLGGSSADGDVSCHPQEVTIRNVTFNSCQVLQSAKNGCTNACEGLLFEECWFNFVRYCYVNNVFRTKFVGGLYVTDVCSMDFVDCTDVLVDGAYFESNFAPLNAAKPGIVNFQNVTDLKIRGNSFRSLITSVGTARDGILVKSNAVNVMRGISITGNRFEHAAIDLALETNAIRFATAGGIGQLVDIVVRDNLCNDWHNAINFTDHITTLATGVEISDVTNTNGVKFLKGIARIAQTALRAPGIWEQFTTYMHGQSSGSGTAVPAASDVWPTVMRSAAPVVTVTNFVNAANAQSLVATWAAIGANSVHIVLNQTAASAANATVEGSATITIDGTSV